MKSSFLLQASVGVVVLVGVFLFLPSLSLASHPSATEGLEITDTYVKAPADKVPRLCRGGTDVAGGLFVTSSANGNFSDAATWGGSLPPENARIRITHQVTYDQVSDIPFQCIEVTGGGRLGFSTTANTKLKLHGELFIMPDGALTIGTETNPVPANITAEILFTAQALQTGTVENPGPDPQQYGRGLITFGDVTIHGHKKQPTFVRLAQEPQAGDTTLAVFETLSGWQVGDEVVLPDTRTSRLRDGSDTQRERLVIQSVSGNTITLASPLKFDHVCARDADETSTITRLENGEPLCAHVGNLSRNIVFSSENPNIASRGHALFLHRSNINVQYAQFKELGRTQNNTLNNSIFDANGVLTHIGTNQIGRYPFHMHHLIGPRNPSNTGYQFVVGGNVVDTFLKWGMTVHNAHYGHVVDNIIYDGGGAGIATEDGSESYNLIEHNFVLGMGGNRNDGSSPFQGTVGDGFWSAAANNSYRNNVSADLTRNGTSGSHNSFTYGYVVWGQVAKNFNSDTNDLTSIPKFRGANMLDPAETEKKYMACDGGCGPAALGGFIEFSGNEAYGGMLRGLGAPNSGRRQFVKNFRAWNFQEMGIRAYDTGFDIDGFIVRGQGNGIGIWEHNAASTIKNADIQNLAVGLETNRGTMYLQDGYLRNKKNIDYRENNSGGSKHRIGGFGNIIFAKPAHVADADYRLATTDNEIPTAQFLLSGSTIGGEPGKNYQIHTEATAPCDRIDCDVARTLAAQLHVEGLVVPVVFSQPLTASQYAVAIQYPLPNGSVPTASPTVLYSVPGGYGLTGAVVLRATFGDQDYVTPERVSTNGEIVFEPVAAGQYTLEVWLDYIEGTALPRGEIAGTRLQIPVTVSDQADPNQPPAADPPPTSSTPTTGINHVPSITLPDNQSPFSVRIGQTLTVPITATDPDGDEITISIPNLSTLLPGAELVLQ